MDTDMGEHELVVGQFAEIAQLPLDQAREIVASQNYNLEEALNFFYAIGPPPEPVQLPPQNFDDLPPSPYRYVNEDTPPGELHRTAGGMHTQHPEDFAVREAPASGSDSVRALLEHARATPADQVPAVPGSSSFASGGRALGSAGVSGGSSRQDAHPNAPIFDDPPIQRTLKFWKDNSFSIDDGERLDLDDPANVAILNQIKNGAVPRQLRDLAKPWREVEVRLVEETTPYQPPPFRAFVSPGLALSSNTSPSPNSTELAISETIRSRAFQLDLSQPTTVISIRFADGSKLNAKFNETHTVGDVYAFVASSNVTRPFDLLTTFPSEVLRGEHRTILEANLKSAMIVQRLKGK
eukprot:c8290_g1_i1.p1 GENE.c8290_g1_i1~~c8290_g1_i1.p1  ORF type:complete len:352 (-),score=62.87 c8290_g1_i1:25-1080(-)